jgi:hypothetical protein
LLAGCDLPPLPAAKVHAMKPGSYHDVAYYEANPIERQQTVAWCRDNPSLQDKTPSCGSALDAKRLEWRREFYGQPAATTDPFAIH